MRNQWRELIELLEAKDVVFAEGLTDSEVVQTEARYGFHFPDDLREFWQTALPIGFPFPNWRSQNDVRLKSLIDDPLHGILFDVERGFWHPEWGARPEAIADALTIAEQLVRQAPKLIPINGACAMPDRPSTAGNPVLSIHQTDIVYMGFHLDDYFRYAFKPPGLKPEPSEIKRIEFWDARRWQEVRWSDEYWHQW